jgi:hypothetical protein
MTFILLAYSTIRFVHRFCESGRTFKCLFISVDLKVGHNYLILMTHVSGMKEREQLTIDILSYYHTLLVSIYYRFIIPYYAYTHS